MNLTNVYSIKWLIRHIVCIPSCLLFHVLPVYKLGLRVTHMNYHGTNMTLVTKVLFSGVCIICLILCVFPVRFYLCFSHTFDMCSIKEIYIHSYQTELTLLCITFVEQGSINLLIRKILNNFPQSHSYQTITMSLINHGLHGSASCCKSQ